MNSEAACPTCFNGLGQKYSSLPKENPVLSHCPALLGGGTVGQAVSSGTPLGTTPGQGSLKALAQAYLAVPLDRDKLGQKVGQAEKFCPTSTDTVGQEKRLEISVEPVPATLPSWVRRPVSGEVLNDATERLCLSPRCMAVFMRRPGESDESWSHKRYCSGACFSGKPSVQLDASEVLQ